MKGIQEDFPGDVLPCILKVKDSILTQTSSQYFPHFPYAIYQEKEEWGWGTLLKYHAHSKMIRSIINICFKQRPLTEMPRVLWPLHLA